MTAARGAAIVVLILLADVMGACDDNLLDFSCDVETRHLTLDVVPDTAEDGTVGYVPTSATRLTLGDMRNDGWDCTSRWTGGNQIFVQCERSCWDSLDVD